ncbi:MAG TPA: hypothetical protein PKZ53_01630 [Acidobacteriota bacterium]|nr:hypothetical protein [Acidobacteriota bacterium]HNJ39161.1 hypothetical protein [Acidobacteriota bacterium]
MNHLLSSFNHPTLSFLKDRMVHVMLIGAALFFFALPLNAHAQGLNWEGQTGAFVTIRSLPLPIQLASRN